MTSNLVINAKLNTSEVIKSLNSLKGIKISPEFTGAVFNQDIKRAFTDVETQVGNFEKRLGILKGRGLFGDVKGIKKLQGDMQGLNKVITHNIGEIHKLKAVWDEASKAAAQGFRANTRRGGVVREAFEGGGVLSLAALKSEDKLKTTTIGKKYAEELIKLEKVKAALMKVNSEYAKSGKRILELGQNIEAGTKPAVNFLNKMGIAGRTVGQIFGTLAGKVATWLVATTGIFMAIRLVKSLVAEMKELQDAQVRLQKILQDADGSMKEQTRTAMDFARAMNTLAGALYIDTIDALTSAKKAGFDFADSMKIAQSALLAINISIIKDTSEATKYLIATIRQFNLNASDSLGILNQWNELAKRTGALLPGIAEGVVRSGKAWKSVGGTLNQLNAVVATTIEQTGESGEKIGTMLKTMAARYADVNRSKSLNNELGKIGIKILKEDGRMFNSIFKVLGKLAGKWGELDDVQKASIAKSAVGVRQYSRFLGVVENFDAIMRALVVSIDSNNSAMNENEKRIRSLDFAIRRMKGAWSALAESPQALNLMTNAITNLAVVVNTLSTGIGKLILTTIGLTSYFFILTAVIAKVSTVIMAHAIKTGLVVTATMPWVQAIGLLIVGLTALIALIGNSRASGEQFARILGETTLAAYKSSEALKNNAKEIGIYYKSLDRLDDKGAKVAATIEQMFKNTTDANMAKILREAEEAGSDFADVLDRIIAAAEGYDAVSRILNVINKDMIGQLKAGMIWNRNIEDDKGRINEVDVALTKLLKGKKLSEVRDELDKVKEKLNETFGEDFYETGEFANAIRKDINKIRREVTDKDIGIDLDFSHRSFTIGKQTPEILLEAMKAMYSTLAEIQTIEEAKALQNAEINQKEKSTRLLKIIQRQYTEEYKIAKKEYDKIKKLNEEMVAGFNDSFLDLKFEGNIEKRLSSAFEGLGDAVWGSVVKDINKDIVKTLTGKPPENMATKIKDAIFIGGDELKQDIIDGFTDGGTKLEQALNNWGTKLATTLGKDKSENFFLKGKYSSEVGKMDFSNYMAQQKIPVIAVAQKIPQLPSLIEKYNYRKSSDPTQGPLGSLYKLPIKKKIPEIGAESLDLIDFGQMFSQFMKGGGLGTTGAGLFDKTGNTGSMVAGGVLSLIGNAIAPGVGGIIGGLLGGLFGGEKPDEQKDDDEQVKYARESVKELRSVNRNLTTMIDQSQNYQLQNESYYFSISNARGLA